MSLGKRRQINGVENRRNNWKESEKTGEEAGQTPGKTAKLRTDPQHCGIGYCGSAQNCVRSRHEAGKAAKK